MALTFSPPPDRPRADVTIVHGDFIKDCEQLVIGNGAHAYGSVA